MSAKRTTSSFGPVSSVLTYDDLDEAVELSARGRGSLVASVVTHDPEVARTIVLGLAPCLFHGDAVRRAGTVSHTDLRHGREAYQNLKTPRHALAPEHPLAPVSTC